nr:hypothetical protein [Streptomyces sp. MMG1121]
MATGPSWSTSARAPGDARRGRPSGGRLPRSRRSPWYALHGRAAGTGIAFVNHFVSIITINDRKITHWRDHLDPVAVFDAVGRPTHHE